MGKRPGSFEGTQLLDVPCQLGPTGESGLAGNCRLGVSQAEACLPNLRGAHAPGGWQMIQNRRDRFSVAHLKRSQKRLRLASEMIEIRARGKIVGHGKFSMQFAWIRKQAARRTCSLIQTEWSKLG